MMATPRWAVFDAGLPPRAVGKPRAVEVELSEAAGCRKPWVGNGDGPGSREDGRSALQNHIRVEPVTPVIGAEVSGVDLGAPLAPDVVEAIRSALMTHLVLFFRDQRLTWPQHKAFGRLFGDLHVHPAAPKDAEHPEILVVHADGDSKFVSGELWHSDVSCDVDPPMGSILRVEQAPPSGGDTLFASMYAAWEALSDRMQRLLEELTAVHEGRQYYIGRYGATTCATASTRRPSTPRCAPIPRPAVPPSTSTRVSPPGSRSSAGRERRPARVPRAPLLGPRVPVPLPLARRLGRVLGNRCTQHHAVWDYYPEVRHGYRVTVQGDRPFYAPGARAGQATAAAAS